MKVLCISDEECPALREYYTPGKLDGYDLILSCGDLKASYLSFLVTVAKCPLFYVHGNHDDSFAWAPPEGCDCIDDYVVEYNGIRFLGLGGSPWYHPGDHQVDAARLPNGKAQLLDALTHLLLGVLVSAGMVPGRAAQTQNAQAVVLHHIIVDAVAPLRGAVLVAVIVIAVDIEHGATGIGDDKA